jgi:hypothetical protein
VVGTVGRRAWAWGLQLDRLWDWPGQRGYPQWRLCNTAARHGALASLQWARANGCDWNVDTCSAAAAGGHLEVLQWARDNGCGWDVDTCTWAAEGGHLKVLQWAHDNGCDWDHYTCELAAGGGHLAVLQWLRANDCDWAGEFGDPWAMRRRRVGTSRSCGGRGRTAAPGTGLTA